MKHRKPPPSLSELAPVTERKVTVGSKSIEAILSELAPAGKLEAPPPDAFTAQQAAKQWGVTREGAHGRIRTLLREGKVERVGMFRSLSRTGGPGSFYYRMVNVSKS